jgi:5-methyltetrahydropteroyltriglutamate--homocysteine methyltransferase
LTAPSPGVVATRMLNQHYDSHEAYLTALAKALFNEYRAIHNAGMILQIDAPDLVMERHRFFSIWTKPDSSSSSNVIAHRW